MKRHLLKSHVSIFEYAERKLVYPASVYSAIKAGKIKPDYIGHAKIVLIDLKKYGSYQFGTHKGNTKETMKKWYARKGKPLHKQPLTDKN